MSKSSNPHDAITKTFLSDLSVAKDFWHYQSLILKRYLKNQVEQKPPLPVIIPLLLYTGKQSPYPYSLELTDCFADKALAQKMLYEPVHLIDLSQLSDDEIKQHGQVALLEMVQKHIRDRDFIAFAYALSTILNKIKIKQNLYISLLECQLRAKANN